VPPGFTGPGGFFCAPLDCGGSTPLSFFGFSSGVAGTTAPCGEKKESGVEPPQSKKSEGARPTRPGPFVGPRGRPAAVLSRRSGYGCLPVAPALESALK